ncbi:MAG: amidase family protein [Pseudonocardiaceae bacterium]
MRAGDRRGGADILEEARSHVAYGATRNPWNLQHTPGGSSGGAAVAVAAGIVPLAAASDGGGSIRIPAACCGVLGFKLSRGLTPAGPSRSETFHGAAVDGAISRTVRDTAVALDALIGVDSGRSYLARLPSAPFADEVSREPPRLRIGATSDSSLSGPSPQAKAALQDAANLLEELGHVVEPVDSPVDHARLAADFLEAWSVNVAAWMEKEITYGGFSRADFEQDQAAERGGQVRPRTGLRGQHRTLDRLCTRSRRFSSEVRPASHAHAGRPARPDRRAADQCGDENRGRSRDSLGSCRRATAQWCRSTSRGHQSAPRFLHSACEHHWPPGSIRSAVLDGAWGYRSVFSSWHRLAVTDSYSGWLPSWNGSDPGRTASHHSPRGTARRAERPH